MKIIYYLLDHYNFQQQMDKYSITYSEIKLRMVHISC